MGIKIEIQLLNSAWDLCELVPDANNVGTSVTYFSSLHGGFRESLCLCYPNHIMSWRWPEGQEPAEIILCNYVACGLELTLPVSQWDGNKPTIHSIPGSRIIPVQEWKVKYDAPLLVKDVSKLSGGCPKCHDPGHWVRTALVCPQHGFFGGF